MHHDRIPRLFSFLLDRQRHTMLINSRCSLVIVSILIFIFVLIQLVIISTAAVQESIGLTSVLDGTGMHEMVQRRREKIRVENLNTNKKQQMKYEVNQKVLPVIVNKHPNFELSRIKNLSKLFYGTPGSHPHPRKSTKTLLPKPIIVVGLPKVGTSSIFSFFHCNGLRSQHWYCCGPQAHSNFLVQNKSLMARCMMNNLANKNAILYECGNYEVLTEMNGPRALQHNSKGQIVGVLSDDGSYDTNEPFHRLFLPQHYYLDEIHRQYPNATFILNKRPVTSWVKSVLHWSNRTIARSNINDTYIIQHQYDLAEQFINEFLYNPMINTTKWKTKLKYQWQNLSSGIGNRKKDERLLNDFLTNLYQHHIYVVKEFVSLNPSHTLVEVDITLNETGLILSNVFGLKEQCWMHRNKNKDIRRSYS